ncbi:hypothetical protein NDU88_004670 [Pleurodeles waltl]|uniref:Uncharacterized protein n=1 Tax=Pleurodeles waltl TaxID=8319 RepID=A0AAV7V537_PLEWA|nr:hypothetical protein NDU88_004670 [Pleurodeles waltl]
MAPRVAFNGLASFSVRGSVLLQDGARRSFHWLQLVPGVLWATIFKRDNSCSASFSPLSMSITSVLVSRWSVGSSHAGRAGRGSVHLLGDPISPVSVGPVAPKNQRN